MPTPTFTPGDNKQDEQLNPGDQDYNRRFNDTVNEGQGYPNVEKGLKDLENHANSKDKNSSKDSSLREQESAGGWKNDYSQGSGKSKRSSLKGIFTKKRSALVGILAILGVGGGLLIGSFGPLSMSINLMQNLIGINDSSSTALERRFLKTFSNTTGNQDPICQNTTKNNLKCKSNKISNSAIKKLENKGVVAYFEGVENDTSKKYPPKNPTGYIINGEKVPAANVTTHLANNPKIAAKVLGTGGAFNVRVMAWTGKNIHERFFKIFGLKKNGGLADGKNKKLTAAERVTETTKRLQERIPGSEKISEVATSVKEKVTPHLNKAAKGGMGYTLAVAGCVGVKAPMYVAAGVAAIQLAQILPIINDISLSPGGKFMAAGLGGDDAANADDAEAVNSLLTDRYPDEKTGKLASAVDSPYLQSAIGVNTNKVGLSQDFTPGLSYLTAPAVVASFQASKATAPACNAIMSPAAMYSALAVDSAVTIAASSTVVLGIAKVAIGFAVVTIAGMVVEEIVKNLATQVLTELAENDKIATATGKPLGDVAGIAGMAFFSAGGMAHNLPTLKQSQLTDYTALQTESETFQRDMDIASLSPFDITSKYTFLGSIVNNVNMASIAKGGYSTNPLSILSTLASLPSSFSSQVGASTNFNANYCGYADDFGLTVTDAAGNPDPGNTPAINASGLPCTGITNTQANMSTAEAIDLMANEGWIDSEKDVPENATINDLLEAEIIKPDNPLSDFIASCSAAETGDYIFNSGGCTTQDTAKSTSGISNCFSNDNAEEAVCGNSEADYESAVTDGVKNQKSLAAISVFLIDYQINASINGEDEQNFLSDDDSTVGDYVLPVDAGYSAFNENQDWGARNICTSDDPNSYCSFNRGVDFTFSSGSTGKPVYSVAEGEVVEATLFNTSCSTTDSGDARMDNRVLIRHSDGTITGYSHMTTQAITAAGIKVGAKVKAGQQIGTIGNCGNAKEANLHFTVSPGSTRNLDVLKLESNTQSETFVTPIGYMALYGVDLATGKYTDGRK